MTENNKIFIVWVTTNQQISAVSGSKVTESRSTFRGHIADWRQHFCLSLRRLFPEISGIESKEQKFWWGICKSTPLPTYRPSLVKIQWLVSHLCWRNFIAYSNTIAYHSAAITSVVVVISLLWRVVLKPPLGNACSAGDVCRDVNAECDVTTGRCQCRHGYQQVNSVCSKCDNLVSTVLSNEHCNRK